MNPNFTSHRPMFSVLLLTAAFGFRAGAQSFVNADFESPGGIFAGWTTNSGVKSAAQAIAGNYSARVGYSTASSGNALTQAVQGDPLSRFTLSFEAAASDPGSTTARSMQLVLRSAVGVSTNSVNLRIVEGSAAGLGTVQVYNGTAWTTAVADAFNLSSAETGVGFKVNTIEIDGDFSLTPFYTVSVNGTTSASLSAFQGNAPGALAEISFGSGNLASSAWSVVDNFTIAVVPEPGVVALSGLGLAGLVAACRRRS